MFGGGRVPSTYLYKTKCIIYYILACVYSIIYYCIIITPFVVRVLKMKTIENKKKKPVYSLAYYIGNHDDDDDDDNDNNIMCAYSHSLVGKSACRVPNTKKKEFF